jgi:hypothetical protein
MVAEKKHKKEGYIPYPKPELVDKKAPCKKPITQPSLA